MFNHVPQCVDARPHGGQDHFGIGTQALGGVPQRADVAPHRSQDDLPVGTDVLRRLAQGVLQEAGPPHLLQPARLLGRPPDQRELRWSAAGEEGLGKRPLGELDPTGEQPLLPRGNGRRGLDGLLHLADFPGLLHGNTAQLAADTADLHAQAHGKQQALLPTPCGTGNGSGAVRGLGLRTSSSHIRASAQASVYNVSAGA
mmetsp:Transcript_7633/g.23376  ORF Transcript_7633/g.23376 Transcript_7633/m.23376 type:complete len:200 (-) Transcript_7633:2-601(-)